MLIYSRDFLSSCSENWLLLAIQVQENFRKKIYELIGWILVNGKMARKNKFVFALLNPDTAFK